jgi:hypothetical protein
VADSRHDEWQVYLSGASDDIDLLCSAIGVSWTVHRDGDQHYLTSPDFETATRASDVKHLADALLRQIEMAQAITLGYCGPIKSTTIYDKTQDGSRTGTITIEMTAAISSTVRVFPPSVGGPAPPTISLLEMQDTLRHDRNVEDAARFYAGMNNDWTANLYKVFEIIRDDVATALNVKPADALGNSGVGWIARDDFEKFANAVHDDGVSGDAARHTRYRRKSVTSGSSNPNSHADAQAAQSWAQAFVRQLLDKWIRWKYQRAIAA